MIDRVRVHLVTTVTVGAAALSGCIAVPPRVMPADSPVARVSFRLEAPGTQHIFETSPAECFLPSDSGELVTAMTYQPRQIVLIRGVGPQRLGMPVTGDYPEYSYNEAPVTAGSPIALRYRIFIEGRVDGQVFREIIFTPKPGSDYEVVTKYLKPSLRGQLVDFKVSEIVRAGSEVRLVPVADVLSVPPCMG